MQSHSETLLTAEMTFSDSLLITVAQLITVSAGVVTDDDIELKR